jgi:hypothetical protein
MAKATRVHSTPRRTASKIQTKKGAKVKRPAPDADAKLTAAYTEIAALDKALDALYKKYGEKRETRRDFLKMEDRRFKLLAVLGSTPSMSRAGIDAKASAILMEEACFGDDRFCDIAVSLAGDIKNEKLIAFGDDRLAASLPRAEQIVELLSTCYVREGWKIDKAAAKRALAYCRAYAKDGSDPDDERKAAMDFFHSHGQSLDWVFCGDIGGMIYGLAKHSERATAVPAPWCP